MAEILERSGYLVKVRVEVPADRVKASYEALLKDLASRVRVPGFRPGKAPEGGGGPPGAGRRSSKTLRSAWWRRPTPRRCGSSA